MAEVMNEHCQAVFTSEREWNTSEDQETKYPAMKEIEITRQEIMNLMKDLDARNSQCPDKCANWILGECR